MNLSDIAPGDVEAAAQWAAEHPDRPAWLTESLAMLLGSPEAYDAFEERLAELTIAEE